MRVIVNENIRKIYDIDVSEYIDGIKRYFNGDGDELIYFLENGDYVDYEILEYIDLDDEMRDPEIYYNASEGDDIIFDDGDKEKVELLLNKEIRKVKLKNLSK